MSINSHPGGAPVEIVTLSDSSQVDDHLSGLQETYEAMYGLDPASATFVPEMIAAHARRPGFRLCMAVAPRGAAIGMAYGFTGLPGQPWRDEMVSAVGPTIAADWLTGHFEFAEFGVVPGHRRRGIGTRLHEATFAALPHRRAVLTVREGNAAAISFYAQNGWETVYTPFTPEAGHGPYRILGRRLTR